MISRHHVQFGLLTISIPQFLQPDRPSQSIRVDNVSLVKAWSYSIELAEKTY